MGSGTELAQLRPYQLGDDVRQLDAAASARTGQAHVRLQVPERILTTWLVVDLSASMAFGTADRLKSDVAEGVAHVVGRAATRHGGRLAVLTAGGPEKMLPPRGGPHAKIGLKRLLEEGVAVDGAADRGLSPVLHKTGRLARQPGLVVVVSDFRGERGWTKPLRALGARHRVLAVEIRDPREERLEPVGRLALVDPESGRLIEVDTSRRGLRERFAAAAAEERAAVAAEVRKAAAQHIVLSTSGDWLKALGRALRVSFASPIALLCLFAVPLAVLAARQRATPPPALPGALHGALDARRGRRRGAAVAPPAAARAVRPGARRARAVARAAAAHGRGGRRARLGRARHRRLALDVGDRRQPDAAGGGAARPRRASSTRSPRSCASAS